MSLQASGTWGGTLPTRRVQSEQLSTDSYKQGCSFKLLHDQNFNVACKRGIRYPSYEVMYCQEKMSLRLSVSISHGYTIVILCIYHSYFDLFCFQADLQGGTGAVRLDLELLKPCLRLHQRILNTQRPSGIFTQSITYIYQGYPNHHKVMTWTVSMA